MRTKAQEIARRQARRTKEATRLEVFQVIAETAYRKAVDLHTRTGRSDAQRPGALRQPAVRQSAVR